MRPSAESHTGRDGDHVWGQVLSIGAKPCRLLMLLLVLLLLLLLLLLGGCGHCGKPRNVKDSLGQWPQAPAVAIIAISVFAIETSFLSMVVFLTNR